MGGILYVLGSTLLAYSTENLVVLLAAWILSTVPFFPGAVVRRPRVAPRIGLLLSSIALAMAIAVIAANGHAMSIAD